MTIYEHIQKKAKKEAALKAAQKQLCYRGVKYTK